MKRKAWGRGPIDLNNKCGGCKYFNPIDETCNGYCLANPYGKNVVCDREHPYWQVGRSRPKCRKYEPKEAR